MVVAIEMSAKPIKTKPVSKQSFTSH